MSANLLAGVEPTIPYNGQYATVSDGVFTSSVRTGVWYNVAQWILPTTQALAENQTVHMGLSAKWHGTAATTGVAYAAVKYADAAGSINNADIPITGITTEWQRFSLSAVVPSGMHIVDFHISAKNLDAAFDATSLVLSYGSPVCLASSAHTPYATQDHLRSEYATKAALKVTSDAVTAEVTERGKLAGRVGTLEGTTGTHTSKLQQLAASITSLVRGESTYTDPDGKSATSGIYSLVTQTRDSVTALFGSYTKTADLASTQAVKDAKKAGTDAQAAASAAQTTADSAKSTAQAAASDAATAKTNAASAVTTANSASTSAASAVSTANSANSTANTAKSTADSLATLIRADSTGITVGKSADGKTWSTGRTRMTDSAFQVLDKAGAVIAQLAGDGVSFLSGLVRIVVGTGTLPGNKTANFIRVDVGSGVAGLSGIISRLDAAINGFTSSVSAGWEQDFGYGVTAIVRESETVSSAAHLASDKAELHVGDNHMTMTGGGYDLSQPEYLTAALLGTGGGGTGVTHSQDAVTMASDLDACGPGVFSYDTSTTSRPTDYGTCVCIRAGDGTTSTWLFEFALPTVGDPLWRRNINGGGWTSWWTITSQ